MKKIIAIVGARPQFIKHFPFEKAAKGKLNLITIHTGQHYDTNMSSIFFKQLNIDYPKYVLNNGGGNHGEQTGKMMVDIEKIIIDELPEGVVVYGDTNSTLAGALVASKLRIPVFHIEAGLRSFNKDMPEEINRILTDHVSSKLFVTSDVAMNNLAKEGIISNAVLVGDLMKDLVLSVIENGNIRERKFSEEYLYATIHRPYNTDNPLRLSRIFSEFNLLNQNIIISLHPRTRKLMEENRIYFEQFPNLIFIDPQSYFDNLNYIFHAKGIITDSGGVQKEAYWLKKKCVTVRTETEWVETLNNKCNVLMFDDFSTLALEFSNDILEWDESLYGDGFASVKIVNEISKY
jgi:UDP-GlcNAc3NAcA epimerase